MDTKVIGGILLVIGTSIGAAMLALPVSTAPGGFIGALILLLGTWVVMTLGAFLVLEVNLWLPSESNLVSMAKATLGPFGVLVTWLSYLLLLYSLLAGYSAGGGDLIQNLLRIFTGMNFPPWVSICIFLFGLAVIVYLGIQFIDYVNRGLMFSKFAALVLLIAFLIANIDITQLNQLHVNKLLPAITVVFTSFGFASIVPSLRTYFQGDIYKLRRVIWIGSLVPLVCYIIWVASVLGTLPLQGERGLLKVLTSGHSASMLTESLVVYLQNPMISFLTRFFTAICMMTSFLGVSLCLSDFLADGIGLKKQGTQKILLYSVTFIPPLLLVLSYPNAFILILSYAGVFCAILLALLPAIMAWKGRYYQNRQAEYSVRGGKFVLSLIMVVAILVIVQELLINFHMLKL